MEGPVFQDTLKEAFCMSGYKLQICVVLYDFKLRYRVWSPRLPLTEVFPEDGFAVV